MENLRGLALSVLNKCFASEQYSNIALDTALRRHPLSDADRGLLTAMVYGVIEKKLTLDHAISHLSSRPMEEMSPDVLNLLRLGIYQLEYLDRVPDHAAVHETVAACPNRQSRGFVNAVLRAYLRQRGSIPLPEEPVERLSVLYSFSPKICSLFLELYGPERTESLWKAFSAVPPMHLRTNTLKGSRETLLAELSAAGVPCVPCDRSKSGIAIESTSLHRLPGFEEGRFFVQDQASQLCVEALDAQPGEFVLDVCACPGSKAFGACIDMNNRGRLIACDLHANKLSLVRSGAQRLGISILETRAIDARQPNPEWLGQADRVLCDVPCSGFGVFAKKPELKYKEPEMSANLPAVQLAILNNACNYVRSGGRLVYSTCTLLPAENGENVRRFLSAHAEFSLTREETLLPDEGDTDGFYIAVLERL